MQFPEHTKESYTAAMEMGAGIVECDVAVTKDGKLVCRHDQCDLHTTTDILMMTDLASKCKSPWDAAKAARAAKMSNESYDPVCCTSDLTLSEFRKLKGKMDARNPNAATIAEYMKGTADWRTDLYVYGTLVTHEESVKLIKQWGRKATPELKAYTQGTGMPTYDEVRAKLVKEFTDNDFNASHVWLQSFQINDIQYWIKEAPEFGKQAVYLDNAYCDGTKDGCKTLTTDGGEGSPFADTDYTFEKLKTMGVNYIAPPQQMLLAKDGSGYKPSEYAKAAKDADLKIITWTLERDGPLDSGGGWYHSTISDNINSDGDMYEMLHVLAKDVGIEGIFSDWPATVTFYANCVKDPIVCDARRVLDSSASLSSTSLFFSAAISLVAAALAFP